MPDQSGNLQAANNPAAQSVDQKLKSIIEEKQNQSDFWSSKDRDRADSAHCLFQYPAMMVPVVQRRLLSAALEAKPTISSVFDPFAGSGTSLVSGMHFGLDVTGNDINPLAILIARTRASSAINKEIVEISRDVVKRARSDGNTKIETQLASVSKWFKPEVALELSKLRRAVRYCEDLWVRRFLWVSLAETIRLTSNDRTSTYKLHSRPANEIARRNSSPLSVFESVVHHSATSILAFRATLEKAGVISNGHYRAESRVSFSDVRSLDAIPPGNTTGFDLLMTSPPYGDNRTTVTYGQHSYLPLNWIDLSDIDPDVDAGLLQRLSTIDAQCLGGRLKKIGTGDEKIFAESPTLKRTALALKSAGNNAQMRLISFYDDFSSSIDAILKRLAVDAHMIWTVGNRRIAGLIIPTDQIISEMLEYRGCTHVSTINRQIHHKRMPSRNDITATMKEEKIIVMRSAN